MRPADWLRGGKLSKASPWPHFAMSLSRLIVLFIVIGLYLNIILMFFGVYENWNEKVISNFSLPCLTLQLNYVSFLTHLSSARCKK